MMQTISEYLLTKNLRAVFGEDKIVPADYSQGFYQIFFSNEKYATQVSDIFAEKGLGDYLGENIGGFISATRPNILIILGNEKQRGEDVELNQVAIKLLEILNSNKEELKVAAGIGISSYRG